MTEQSNNSKTNDSMDGPNFGKLIATLFLSFRFIIIPLCPAIIVIFKVFTLKGTLKRAGINYFKEDKKISVSLIRINIISLFILLAAFVFMLLVGHPIFSILCFSASIYFSGTMIINKFYGNIFGIYKNGIIDYNMNLNLWKEIHSYNIIEKTIYGYYHDGNKFEYNNIEKIDEIKELFEKNNVQKRDDK